MISKHISYKEGVYSTTALRRGINNEPNEEQLANMKLIGEKIFEPLRLFVGGPINRYIKDNLDFDQMIWEFGDDNNPNWVHVSYVSPEKNRKVCLKAYKEKGRTKYKTI